MSLLFILRKSNFFRQNLIKSYKLSTVSGEKIEIPYKIHRSPTDVLRALESTIKKDPTASHYKYHDDPYLIPTNNLNKRTFAMAQEAGRKAAHWVRQENPGLFNHKECDPPIEKFFPKMVYNEESHLDETDLLNVMEKNEISDIIMIYNLLNKKGIPITMETKENLLQLLCYTNSDQVLNEDFIEERWFKQSSSLKDRQRKTWNDGSIADEIFSSLETPNAASYSAIIQGMAKYNQASKAYNYFEEAQQKGLILNVDTYNAVIRVSNFLKDNYDLRWTFTINMLENLKEANLKPNLGTLNAILFTLSTMGNSQNAKELILKTINEFNNINIRPCLGSWYYVLITFCKDRGQKSGILKSILQEIENKEHEIQDLSDTNFFVTAMDIAKNHLNDISIGQRIHNLLLFGNNYNLIGDSYKESIYYRHYFGLLLHNLPYEEFMQNTYNQLVPNIYVPEPSVMRQVIEQIDLSGNVEYLPQIWSDMVIFNQTNREELINSILNVMINNKTESNDEYGRIAWEIYSTIDAQNDTEKFNILRFTGEILGKILILVLRNDDFEKSCTIMDKLNKEQQSILGVPTFDAISLFVDHCIKNKTPSKAINCIQFAHDSGFPDVLTLASKLNEQLTLDETHLTKLSKFIKI